MNTVEITSSTRSVVVGANLQLSATTKDASGALLDGRVITWSTANASIATVSTTGMVTGVTPGTVVISGSSEGKIGTAEVVVTPVPVATVEVGAPAGPVTVGSTIQLVATAKDGAGNVLSGRIVAWSSGSASIATVSATGLVTGVAPGTVAIIATVEGRTGNAQVTVIPVPVARVEVAPPSGTVHVGSTLQLSASPKDAGGNTLGGRTVSWTSSNTAVGTVSNSGLVTGLTPGSLTVTATSEGKSGTAELMVTPAPVAVVEISPPTPSVAAGATVQLTAAPKDQAGNLLADRAIAWTSGNTSVATVSPTGLVTGIAPGVATVLATSEGKTGTAQVTVTPAPVATVDVLPPQGSVTVGGGTLQLAATTKDGSENVLSGRTVSWSSSNSLVATVSTSGLVTGVTTGSVTITATSEGRSGSSQITVVPQFALVIRNRLNAQVQVSGNGLGLGTVPASGTRTFSVATTEDFEARWDLIRPTLDGLAVGEAMAETFTVDVGPSGTTTYEIDALVGSQQYVDLIITNNTPSNLLMAVNWGQPYEVRCNCVVLSSAKDVNIGYYRLHASTDVRAYRSDVGYSGWYIQWRELRDHVPIEPGSGIMRLTNTITLPTPGLAGTQGLDLGLAAPIAPPDH